MKLRFAAALAALTLATAPAQAVITSITLSGGAATAATILTTAPAAVPFNSGTVFVGFNELQNVTVGTGANAPRAFLVSNGAFNASPTNFASSVAVSSHFFFLGSSSSATGTITFNQNVIGIMRGDGLVNNARNDQFETGATDFSAGGFSLEARDLVTFVNPKTISFDLNSGAGTDGFRILTAVPEPTSWVMLIAGFGMVGAAARRRKTVVAA